MKITPLTSGGMPGQSIGNITTERTSPDRIAAAKAIAAGETPIRVMQVEDPQVQRAQESIRKIKMRTNVSPDRDMLQEPLIEEPLSIIADENEQSSEVLEETKPLSPQFAALAKQRRALQVKERELLDKEKALESRASQDGSQDFIAQLKSQPLRVLLENGVTYDQLTEAILNEQSGFNPEIAELKAKIEALEKGVDSKLSERDSQAEQQVVEELKREAEALVSSSDEYKYTRAMRKQHEAARLVHENWKQTGQIWDVTHALSLIEAECKKDYEALTSVISPQPATPVYQEQSQAPRQMKTLTNRDSATVPMDRRTRAIMAMNGTLKRG